MDRIGLLGLVFALFAIIGGNAIEGGELQQLLNLPAAVIVIGGTLAAVAVQSPTADFLRAFWWVKHLAGYRSPSHAAALRDLCHWCALARKSGVLGLEAIAEEQPEGFVQNGLRMIVDGASPEMIRAALETEMICTEQRELRAVNVIESMGGYAPTLGIVGAVLGLIHVLSNLTDPGLLGAGIATAFVATVYGVGIANLLLIPVANRIRALVQARYQYQEMLMEGFMLIADGKTPPALVQRLKGYID